MQSIIPNLQFWIGGKAENASYEQYIKNFVERKGIKKITKFFGFVSEEKKYELFSRAWVLVHPSMKEGWGLNVIEANACGTVAVAYTVAGLVDSIQNNKTGLLVGEQGQNNLEKGLADILMNTKRRRMFEKNARTWSENFSWEKAGKISWEVIQRK